MLKCPVKLQSSSSSEVYSGQLGPKYRAILPKAVREVLHVREGDTLLYFVDDGKVTLTTRLLLAQQLAGAFKREDGLNLTQALIEDRRAEAENDL